MKEERMSNESLSTHIGNPETFLKPNITVGEGANEESLCFALGLYRGRISGSPHEYVSESGGEPGKTNEERCGPSEGNVRNSFVQSQIEKMEASASVTVNTPGYISSSSSEKSSEQQHQQQELHRSSSNSVATISTHEIRLPMYLPNFKPATGCTNASDFTVRCFAARLRAGITVVKHGRSRWCKSRLRILHVHSDGRSLTWKPAPGEPTSKSKPPKLDLSNCMEVRHAGSPDPLFPMFTGTPILRHKCEATNAHKSFALIFSKRTVDITALTADQCKVLMEGFSALCFRLQVANLAHSKGKVTNSASKTSNPHDEDEDIRSTTESNTLTNNSMVDNRPLQGYATNNSTNSLFKRSNYV